MDTILAFAMGNASRGKKMMVFDWDKAARLIVGRNASDARDGLRSDWEWTGGTIWSHGKPDIESYTYLASTWAVPEIEIDGEVEECYRMEDETPDWGSDTKWPASALAIVEAVSNA